MIDAIFAAVIPHEDAGRRVVYYQPLQRRTTLPDLQHQCKEIQLKGDHERGPVLDHPVHKDKKGG